MKITTKKQMYRMLQSGEFGNTACSWPDIPTLLSSGWNKPVGLRTIGRPGGRCDNKMEIHEVEQRYQEWLDSGYEPHQICICEAPPSDQLILQGEVITSERHYDLWYSTVKAPMRVAFAQEQLHANFLKASCLLKSACDPSSYEDLMVLMDRFPSSVVEFSCFRVNVGNIPNRNTIIWEVRNY